MRKESDFTSAKGNPYTGRLTQQIMVEVDLFVANYFDAISLEAEIPTETLISSFLRECASRNRLLTH